MHANWGFGKTEQPDLITLSAWEQQLWIYKSSLERNGTMSPWWLPNCEVSNFQHVKTSVCILKNTKSGLYLVCDTGLSFSHSELVQVGVVNVWHHKWGSTSFQYACTSVHWKEMGPHPCHQKPGNSWVSSPFYCPKGPPHGPQYGDKTPLAVQLGTHSGHVDFLLSKARARTSLSGLPARVSPAIFTLAMGEEWWDCTSHWTMQLEAREG